MNWVPSQGSWVWPSPDLILFFLSRQTLDLSVEGSKLMDQIRPSTSRYFAKTWEISWKIKMQCFLIRTLFRWTRTSEVKHLEDKQLRFVSWPPAWSWRWWESRPDWAGHSPSCRLRCTAGHARPVKANSLPWLHLRGSSKPHEQSLRCWESWTRVLILVAAGRFS